MSIRIVCKSCGSKIDAKDELRGQTRRCPKCHNPILIEPEPTAGADVSSNAVSEADSPKVDITAPEPLKIRRLRPNNLYVILGTDCEIAYWKGAEGWFVNVGNGFEAVKRAPDKLPDIGTFALVEGNVVQTDAGRRLKGLRIRKLAGRGVLQTIVRGGEADILEKTSGPVALTGPQKRFMLQHIRNHYFFEFTDDAPEIIEYLTGFDSHSDVVGTFTEE